MAFSLAIEKPIVTHSVSKGFSVPRFHPSSGSTEVKIWLLALVPSGIVLLVGVGAMLIRRGVLVSSLAAIAVSLAVMLPLDRWTSHHSARFPEGTDLIKDSDPSNLFLRGEWEQTARNTATSLGRWTIVIAVAAMALAVLLEMRRRLGPVPPSPPPEGVAARAGVVRRWTRRR